MIDAVREALGSFELEALEVAPLVRAALLLLFGLALGRILGRGVRSMVATQLGPHRALILQRIVTWGVATLFAINALREVGFELSVLLGTAGVLTVAVGFASQTAASNLVSGLFLIGESPFQVGEVVKVDQTTGEVLSIDLLSVKLRTFDNLLVRIPNESLIKAQVTNFTRFPIRRFDLQLSVAYRSDLAEVERVLIEAVDANPLCLDEPRPLVILLGFADSGIDVQLSAWALRENFLAMRNSMHRDAKRALEAADIEIPFPHRVLIGGAGPPVRHAGQAQ